VLKFDRRIVGGKYTALVFAFSIANMPLSAQSIDFQYEDHPPFVYEVDGKVTGIFVDVTVRAANLAGFEVVWKKRTFNRLKRDLEDGAQPFCASGHSKTPEAESKWHVTDAIGHFGRTGLLVRESDKAAIASVGSIQALFEQTSFIGGFVKGAVYAVPYEQYLVFSHDEHLITSSNHEQLAQLVAKGRLDFVFIDEVMLPMHQKVNAVGAQLGFVTFPEMPGGAEAHIICTKAVPASWVVRLNHGIEEATKKAALE